jgi:hypothetical protein
MSGAESLIQQELISCCNFLEVGFVKGLDPVPELSVLYHIVNEGKRSLAEGAKLKREGLRKGIPDLALPVPSHCGNFCGLYIEMKTETGIVSEDQKTVIRNLRRFGNRVVVRRTAKKALQTIMEHLNRLDVCETIAKDYNRIKNPL